MLAKIRRPWEIAWTMVAKLSSVRTREEADLATSDPFRPIAMPMGAFLREGESRIW